MKVCTVDGCDRERLARGWCNMHYRRWRRHGDTDSARPNYRTPEEAFAARTERCDECLIWTGVTNGFGYGQIRVRGRMVQAHRYAWERTHGSIPDGMEIDHTCWNRACVNVEHLRLATTAQNRSNRNGATVASRSGIRGVYRRPSGKYLATASKGGDRHEHLFPTEAEAIAWLEEKHAELFGEFKGAITSKGETQYARH